MTDWLVPALLAVNLVLLLVVLAWLLLRLRPEDPAARQAAEQLQAWLAREPQQREAAAQERALARQQAERDAQALRGELNDGARATRQELAGTLSLFQQALLTQSGDVARTQNEQIDSFRTQLAAMQQSVAQALQQATSQLAQQGQAARDAQDAALRRQAEASAEALQRFGQQMQEALGRFATQSHEALQRFGGQSAEAQARLGELLGEQLKALSEGNAQRLAEVRQTVESRLAALQAGNEQKLEQMRATVDEKLHATLEQRLGESFKQVSERLEQVHQGLGEMKNLARDVGSLNRVLTNVKTRGIYGEVQLAGLLEQVFTPEQYAANVETVPGSGARVEFAIRLPGRGAGAPPLWLPIDAKFPREDYERLLDAQERADAPAAEAASRAIEQRLRLEARSIREKYLAAPYTTDFAILFVPTESLYAEVLRRPGLAEALQREHRITLAGPTTLLATLTSLQMGFRTLALEKRSAEVWEVLGAVKTEFGKFGEVLAKTKKKLEEASNTIDAASVRTRAMERRLRSVEALPENDTTRLLGAPAVADEAGAEDGG